MYDEFGTVSKLVESINKSYNAKPEEFRFKTLNNLDRYPTFLGGTAQGLMNGEYIIKIDQRTERVKIDWEIGYTYEKDEKVIFVESINDIPRENNPKYNERYGSTFWNSPTKPIDYSIAYGKKTVNSKYNVYRLNFDKFEQLVSNFNELAKNFNSLKY